MRSTVLMLAASLPAQNLSILATENGCCDLSARIEKIDRPYLVLPAYETALTVFELGDAMSWWWSYIVPPVGLFRDGAVERVSATAPVALRVPLDAIPPGVWRFRVGTVYGYSDVLTLTVY